LSFVDVSRTAAMLFDKIYVFWGRTEAEIDNT